MEEEIIKWYVFPKEIPKEIRWESARVMIKRKGRKFSEFAILDNNKIYLDCNGINGGAVVDNNEISSIALRPSGP